MEPLLDEGLEIDVLLLDIQMQTLHGDALCTRLRAKGYKGPIVAVTGRCRPCSPPLPMPLCGAMRSTLCTMLSSCRQHLWA